MDGNFTPYEEPAATFRRESTAHESTHCDHTNGRPPVSSGMHLGAKAESPGTDDDAESNRQCRQERREEFLRFALNDPETLDANMAVVAANMLWVADYLQEVLLENKVKRGTSMEAFKMAEPAIQLMLKTNRELDKHARFATRHENDNAGGVSP